MKPILASLAILFTLAFSSSAHAGDWERLGAKTVNYRADRDVLPVTILRGDFRRIKIFVEGGAVNFRDIRIHYRNGGVQDVAVRATIPAGGETRVIDLDGGDRVISKIEFVYDTRNRADRRARVIVWAKD